MWMMAGWRCAGGEALCGVGEGGEALCGVGDGGEALCGVGDGGRRCVVWMMPPPLLCRGRRDAVANKSSCISRLLILPSQVGLCPAASSPVQQESTRSAGQTRAPP